MIPDLFATPPTLSAQISAVAAARPANPDGWPELPKAALYGLAGDVVRTIESHSEADPAAILIQTLAAVGNMIGPAPHCTVESTRHSLNLYAALMGESSKARKGTSWSHIEGLCSRVDKQWTLEHVTGGLSSAEGLIAEVRDGANPAIDRRLISSNQNLRACSGLWDAMGKTCLHLCEPHGTMAIFAPLLKITRSKQLARTSVLLGISLAQSYCAICQTQSNTTASVIAFYGAASGAARSSLRAARGKNALY
jgi:hypothetical protein